MVHQWLVLLCTFVVETFFNVMNLLFLKILSFVRTSPSAVMVPFKIRKLFNCGLLISFNRA